jgi:hypothetical protein
MQRPREARQAQIAFSNPLRTRHTSPGCRRIQCHGRRLDTRLVSIPAKQPSQPSSPAPKAFPSGSLPQPAWRRGARGRLHCAALRPMHLRHTPSSHADPLPTARHQPRGGEVTGTGWPLSASLISANYSRCTYCVHRRRLLRAARHRHASPSGISTRPHNHTTNVNANASNCAGLQRCPGPACLAVPQSAPICASLRQACCRHPSALCISLPAIGFAHSVYTFRCGPLPAATAISPRLAPVAYHASLLKHQRDRSVCCLVRCAGRLRLRPHPQRQRQHPSPAMRPHQRC